MDSLSIEKHLIRPDSVVLASGGARGITARCVVELARYAHCRFILLGRSPLDCPDPGWAAEAGDENDIKRRLIADHVQAGEKPSPALIHQQAQGISARREIRQTLQAIEAAGGQAAYINVDVSDRQDLQNKLSHLGETIGPITGIIHGAGSLADKRIERKTAGDFERVFSPKVDGLDNLLSCVSPSHLDFLVFFSSIVGFFGNIGQVDYAIANEVLNKTAYHIQHENPNCRVISINWGPWDSGMVNPALKQAFEERGMQVIPSDAGAKMLLRELVNKATGDTQIIVGSKPSFQPGDPGVQLKTYHIRRRIRLDDNPFLFDHVIGDHPVLPATCAALWIVSTCEQLYPGYSFLSLDDFKVLKGIVFENNDPKEYHLDLEETAKNGEIDFNSRLWSENSSGKQFNHYTVKVRLTRRLPPPPRISPSFTLEPEYQADIPGLELYQNGTLFHGPSFRGVERVLSLAPTQLTMQCTLPKINEKTQGQFPVHTANPYIYDTIVQCLLIWAQRYYDAPCLPSSLDQFIQYRPIPFEARFYVTMKVVKQSDKSVTGDILVQDGNGEVYVEIKGLEGTISKQLKRLFPH